MALTDAEIVSGVKALERLANAPITLSSMVEARFADYASQIATQQTALDRSATDTLALLQRTQVAETAQAAAAQAALAPAVVSG